MQLAALCRTRVLFLWKETLGILKTQTFLAMKLTVILFFVACLQVGATGFGQKISLSGHDLPLKKVFKEIQKQSDYFFFYSDKDLNNSNKVTINASQSELALVLDQIFTGQPLTYSIIGKTVVVKEKPEMVERIKENIEVTGRVVDDKGNGIAGVSVTEKGTRNAVASDEKGFFLLKNVKEDAVLVFTGVNIETREVKVVGKRALSEIYLKSKVSTSDEILVMVHTGYQALPKDRITGSFDIVKAKEIKSKSSLNILERLEGIVPGLVMINGKDDGSDDGLTIRGVSTLYGTKRPLIVVDNFPIEGDITSINPNDVASITVLKDAAAASIWGARAANGVIVITTKNGTPGKLNLSYRNSFQFSAKPDLSQMHRLPSADDILIEQRLQTPTFFSRVMSYPENYTLNGLNVLYLDSIRGIISPLEFAAQLNILKKSDNSKQIRDLLMQSPFTQSHSVSLNGGSAENQYYGSLLYSDQNSYALKDNVTNVSAYFKNNIKINKRLSFSASMNYTQKEGTSAPVNPIDIFRLKPYSMIADADGNPLPVMTKGDPNNQNISNVFTIRQRNNWGLLDETYYPLLELNKRDISNSRRFTRIQAELNYSIMKGVSAQVSYQYEIGSDLNRDYKHQGNAEVAKLINDFTVPQYDAFGNVVTNPDGTISSPKFYIPHGGIISETRNSFSAYTLRGVVNINRGIGQKGILSAVIGGEQRKLKSSGTNLTRYGYDDNSLKSVAIDEQVLKTATGALITVNNGFQSPGNDFSYVENRFISLFGNAAYTFLNKYVLSASSRMDATNLFGTDPKYRYRPLWSTGVSWIVSREKFLQSKTIQNLALRATYGINGNIPKESGPFMLARADVNWLNSLPSYSIYSPANNQLHWEKTAVFNLGLDFDILGRIQGKFDWYRRNSTQLLSDFAINPTTGFSTALLNTGDMMNNGLELELTTRNIVKKDFEWRTTFMLASNKNTITKVTTSEDYNTPYYRAAYSPQGVFVKGYPYGSLFSFKFAGLDDKGQVLVFDEKGKKVAGSANEGMLSSLDAIEFSGGTRPITTGSFGSQILYKNIEFSFLFVYYGSYYNRRGLPSPKAGNVNSYDRVLADFWKKPGDELVTDVPSLVINPDYSSYYGMVYYRPYLGNNVFNASYLKLREIRLAYNFNRNLLSKLKYVKNAQFTLEGRNLWTATKNNLDIDPESFSGGYPGIPIMPTYVFGLNVNF